MTLIIGYFLFAILFSSLVCADDSIKTSVVGCNIDAISSQNGFDGVFYQFSDIATSVYSDPSFYAHDYKSGVVGGTASDVTEINFSLPGGQQTLFGVSVNSSNYAIEFTGYFKGEFTLFMK